MLVTCPECGAKVSDKADPCPNCGFPKAGSKSEECYKEILGGKRCTEYDVEFTSPHIPTCHKCGHEIVGKRKIKNEVEKGTDGYSITHSTVCPNCGTILKNYFIP